MISCAAHDRQPAGDVTGVIKPCTSTAGRLINTSNFIHNRTTGVLCLRGSESEKNRLDPCFCEGKCGNFPPTKTVHHDGLPNGDFGDTIRISLKNSQSVFN